MSMMGMWWSWEICLGSELTSHPVNLRDSYVVPFLSPARGVTTVAGTIGVTALAAHSCVTNLTFFYFNAISATSMATACVSRPHRELTLESS